MLAKSVLHHYWTNGRPIVVTVILQEKKQTIQALETAQQQKQMQQKQLQENQQQDQFKQDKVIKYSR